MNLKVKELLTLVDGNPNVQIIGKESDERVYYFDCQPVLFDQEEVKKFSIKANFTELEDRLTYEIDDDEKEGLNNLGDLAVLVIVI